MRDIRAEWALCVGVLAMTVHIAGSGGLSFYWLSPDQDSRESILVAQTDPAIAKQAAALSGFLTTVVPANRSEIERVMGRPSGRNPDSTYAMPICQERFTIVAGSTSERASANHQFLLVDEMNRARMHQDFYAVNEVGGVQVLYLHDSTTVALKVAFLKVDSHFIPYTRETQNQLDTRLQWDKNHVAELERTLRRRFEH
jgi:hypothetical protein